MNNSNNTLHQHNIHTYIPIPYDEFNEHNEKIDNQSKNTYIAQGVPVDYNNKLMNDTYKINEDYMIIQEPSYNKQYYTLQQNNIDNMQNGHLSEDFSHYYYDGQFTNDSLSKFKVPNKLIVDAKNNYMQKYNNYQNNENLQCYNSKEPIHEQYNNIQQAQNNNMQQTYNNNMQQTYNNNMQQTYNNNMQQTNLSYYQQMTSFISQIYYNTLNDVMYNKNKFINDKNFIEYCKLNDNLKLNFASIGQILMYLKNIMLCKSYNKNFSSLYLFINYHIINLINKANDVFYYSSNEDFDMLKYNLFGYNGSIKYEVFVNTVRTNIKLYNSTFGELLKTLYQRLNFLLKRPIPKRYQNDVKIKMTYDNFLYKCKEFLYYLSIIINEWKCNVKYNSCYFKTYKKKILNKKK
jgi:hypothetical protein